MTDYPFGRTLDEMDTTVFLNVRNFVQTALEEKGAVNTDAGIGMGQADLGMLIDGMPFSISIRPRMVP